MDLPEDSTVWIKGGNDGFGGFSWLGPYPIKCRIAYSAQKFTDTNGDQLVSTAVMYSESEHAINGASVLLGEVSTSPEPTQKANDIRQTAKTPSGTNLKKAWFS